MIIINEIAWMGTTESANDEWLELYNPSNQEIDLNGWQLLAQDNSPKIGLKGKIRPMAFFLLERTDDNSAGGAKADLIYTGALNNNGEHLQLIDAQGNMVDEINGSGGWQAGDNQTKQTMERVNNDWPASNAEHSSAGWQTSQNPGGTAKAQNSSGAEIVEVRPLQFVEDGPLPTKSDEIIKNESLQANLVGQEISQEVGEINKNLALNNFSYAKNSFVFVFLFGLIASLVFAGLILFLKKRLREVKGRLKRD